MIYDYTSIVKFQQNFAEILNLLPNVVVIILLLPK
jgi:hypothetical protein